MELGCINMLSEHAGAVSRCSFLGEVAERRFRWAGEDQELYVSLVLSF